MDRVHDLIAWYQKKIGSYDKQLWEQSVESKIFKSLKHVPRRSVRVKTELIDVDLVRGSTFSKAKPEVSWTYITRKAITRVVFFPLCSKWWIQQTSVKFWLLLLILYCLQVTAVAIFFRNIGGSITKDEMILSEVMIPLTLMFILGLVHSQTVLSHYSHRGLRDKGNRDSKGRRIYRRSVSMPGGLPTGPGDPSSIQDAESNTANTKIGQAGKEEEKSMGDGKSRIRKKKTFGQGKSVSWSDVYKRPNDCSLRDRSSVDSDESEGRAIHSKSLLNSVRVKNDVVKELKLPQKTLHKLNSHRSSGSFESDILTEEEEEAKDNAVVGCENINQKVDSVISNCEILSSDLTVIEAQDKDSKLTSSKLTLPNGEGSIIHQENGKIKLNNSLMVSVEKSEKHSNLRHVPICNGNAGDSASTDSTHSSGNDHVKSSDALSVQNLSQPHTQTSNFTLKCEKSEETICQRKKESETDSDREESDHEVKSFQGIRRRKPQQDDSSGSGASYVRVRRNVGITSRKDKDRNLLEMEGIDKSHMLLKNEEDNKATISSEEWEDRVQSDVTSSSFSSTSESEAVISENEESNLQSDASPPLSTLSASSQGERTVSSPNVINLLQPPSSTSGLGHIPPPDKVSCVIWEASECKKVELTALDIGWTIIEKVDNIPESSDYILLGFIFSVVLGLVPVIFRLYHHKDLDLMNLNSTLLVFTFLEESTWRENFIFLNGIIQRLLLSAIFFFMLSVADRTFKQRLLYAKHFCYLTSSRRAKKFDMPHFRLNKVRNIKTWLSLRSYLKKRGPQRSVDVIVSAAFLISIIILTLMCLQLLKDTDKFLDFLCNWELLLWCMALGMYLMHYMTLGLKINKKYRNLSVLITEQINLYLQMEQKPHKKEELMVANNVLKLAEDLLKELESPFKISGVSANPVIYNVIKVVVLSAFSAVLTELLGFKLKLYKIKLRA